MCREGLLEAIGFGVYKAAGQELSQGQTLAALARMTRDGAISFFSALHLHGLWPEAPVETWLLLGKGGRLRDFKLPVRVFRTEGQALRGGVSDHRLDGVSFPVTSPEKAVADILRWQDEIGCQAAEAALAAYLGSGRADRAELWRWAGVCGVEKQVRNAVIV